MKIRYAIPAAAALAALTLTGCSGGAAANITTAEEIESSGVLLIATDAEYPPNEFKDAQGNPTGWAVELAEALAKEMGLEPEWEVMGFDSILPRIEEGVINLGSSSFTDTLERQQTVDFVNYLNAGTMWAAADGSVDPDNACGLTVAVQQGVIQQTHELPARNQKCIDEGKPAIEILIREEQSAATNDVVNGGADAVAADFPVILAAVAESGGVLQVVSDEMIDAAPYGFAVQKESGMAEAVREALQRLMDDGTYLDILTRAGVEVGAIDTATVNAATE